MFELSAEIVTLTEIELLRKSDDHKLHDIIKVLEGKTDMTLSGVRCKIKIFNRNSKVGISICIKTTQPNTIPKIIRSDII